MRPFDLFVGVDWSGNKSRRLKGLSVATASPGDAAPSLVPNPNGGRWTRADFMEWLLDLYRTRGRVLCGLDFSFGFPFCDRDCYFPNLPLQPGGAAELWKFVEDVCGADPHLAASSFLIEPGLSDHFYTSGSGRARFRVTETACAEAKLGRPECMFKIVGHSQVAKSSLTGMRVLSALGARSNDLAVWPFDPESEAKLVLVEVFPTAFVRRAGAGIGKVREAGRLNGVLDRFDSAPVQSGDGFRLTDDMTDALITAAALRNLHAQPSLWHPPGLSDRVRRFEGWTFGIA
ncbi:MAG: hypothetical protein AB7O49_07350 [Sphingomonadales bacterium]